MRGNFGSALAGLVVAVAVIGLAAGDTKIAGGSNGALGVVQLVKAAEADYFHAAGRYATFAELIKSRQLAQTAAHRRKIFAPISP